MGRPRSLLLLVPLLAGLLTAALLQGRAEGADHLPPGGSFVDDDESPHEGSIEALAAAGATEGCDLLGDRFCPGHPLSRAEAVALLTRSLEGGSQPGASTAPSFRDVPGTAWFWEAVGLAASLGIVEGDREGRFRPDDPVLRSEMAVMAVRAVDGADLPPPRGVFRDVPPDAWFASSVEEAWRRGITEGCGTDPLRFCPGDLLRRDEAAAFLARALRLEPLEPPPGISGEVREIVSADLLRVRSGASEELVRLAGIQVPAPGECGHDRAGEVLASLVGGRIVTLREDGGGEPDRAGGRRIYTDEGLVQGMLVARGWAEAMGGTPALAGMLGRAEDEARSLGLGLWSPGGACIDRPVGGEPRIRLEEAAHPVHYPIHVTAPPGDDRLFVVEQTGAVRMVDETGVHTFLDLSDEVRFGAEQGLLGMAFHPDYWTNGRFFVYLTYEPYGDARLEEWRVSSDPDRADSATRRVLLNVDQPHEHHNGGMLAFGPDGMLFLSLGDGGHGSAWNAQDPGTLLGSILRVDVDGEPPYDIPPDNPYAGGGGAGEVWHHGLRNPWRFWFDGVDGTLHIADVGEHRFEEIDVVEAAAGGLDFGWPIREGEACLEGSSCRAEGLVSPDLVLRHADGECAVVGGATYRGYQMPGLLGRSFYTDFCSGRLRSYRVEGGSVVDHRDHTAEVGRLERPTSIGIDGMGRLYVAIHGGRVQRIVAAD